ncbi:type III toxin-antitoxin system ToxN/AbiQ family toxin [Glaesserella parasuis]|uniref:type III toxin-antitoxin system ToxN/AbiQ family toxin n=1 Tax=Glaesserella parasuis TaxID=738 RepID=UPI0027161594|nr:type III toxin-antitoxin system ToxN/AbiQ family toxin [Glaesserella parasuis]MDO9696223.1 type III toxin-antitoxin system ToxN/AbiQ family toxin [Glaesserella parasuis]
MKQELQLKLCRINPEYTKFLHSIDTRISPEKELDKNKRRIFVGVVLTINHISYFAPLSSAPNTKNNKKPFDKRFVIKITTGFDNKKTIAGIKLNNMFPVLDTVIKDIDLTKEFEEEHKYASLLMKEMLFINNPINQRKIKEKATKVYSKAINKKDNFEQYCCNFKLLEEYYQGFEKSQ